MYETKSPRRTFLKVIGGAVGAAGACAMGASLSGCGGVVSAGNVSSVAMNSLSVVSGESLAIGRDANGVYALSTICTHQGCDMSLRGDISYQGVFCGCHGAQFDADGNPVAGPARGPLAHYPLTIDASGNITVDMSSTVAATTRTAVAAAT